MAFIGALILIGIGIAQLIIGFQGIEYHFGEIWAFIALFAAFFLRIMFPLTIGCYFGAVDVLGWEWYSALLITAPGFLFIAPSMIGAIIQTLTNKR